MVVSFLTAEADMGTVLSTRHHVLWSMEIIGHSFALPMEDADVIHGALRIYEQWLAVEGFNVTNGAKTKERGGNDKRPSCMLPVEQKFIQDLLGQMTLIFEERSDASRSGTADTALAKQVSLCSKVLDIFDVLAKTRGAQLSTATWDRMLRLLIGAADGVLHSSRNVLGNQLCSQTIRILFESFIRSLCVCGPRSEIWNLLQKFCRRWIHRIATISQWNSICFALTKNFMQRVHAQAADKIVEIDWADQRVSSVELNSPLLAYAWYRLFRIIGHPIGITDTEVYLEAIKGIGYLVAELTRIDQNFTMDWEHSTPESDGKRKIAEPSALQLSLNPNGSSEDRRTRRETIRSPPDVSSILRLVGPWLYDACLSRKSRYNASRCEALSCLGKLLCEYSGGRTKQIQWTHTIRCLMALETALKDEDEHVVAAAVYNHSKIFTSYGNHTLRGVSVISGVFHSAIDRLLKEQGNLPPAQNNAAIDPIRLRRACIEACGSLVTLHSHYPRSLVVEAEKQVLTPEMENFSGLYSSSSKHTSASVVVMLMNALKAETDPINQQMIIWILCLSVQQEARFWNQGLTSTRNSQVHLTILHVCSVITKSNRYKATVLFACFQFLRELVPVANELATHAMGSVILLINACCEFITTHAPALRLNRSPFYLDSLLALIYTTVTEWILAAPVIMAKNSVVVKVIQAILDGRESRAGDNTSNHWKTSALNSPVAAESLLTMLMKHHVADAAYLDVTSSCSSILDEQRILREICGVDENQIARHCRFFAVRKEAILTVIEKQPDSDSGEAICIIRDVSGRYVWRSKPRYHSGHLPFSVSDFKLYNEEDENKKPKKIVEKKAAHVSSSRQEEEYEHAEPDLLLQVIRQVDNGSNLTSWKSQTQDSAENRDTITLGEGNTGRHPPTANSKSSSADQGTERDVYDSLFQVLLQHQMQQDSASQEDMQTATVIPSQPLAERHAGGLKSFQLSRRMLTELGFASVRNWGSIFALSVPNDNFMQDLTAFDQLSDRETMEFAILYAVNEHSHCGYDSIRILDHSDTLNGNLSTDYMEFLSAIGHCVSLNLHNRYSGSLPGKHVTGQFLYHAQYQLETCYLVPTLPLKHNDSRQEALDLEPLLRQMDVLILWNECQQKYRPGTALWEATYQLPSPKTQLIIIIEPLNDDLFCVHICQSNFNTALFGHRDMLSAEKEDYLDEGEVYCSRVLGPLLDGMVLNGSLLAPLIRKTAINATRLWRGYEKYQSARGASANPNSRSDLLTKRGKALGVFIEKHMCAKLPGEFYGNLFTDVELQE